jgi:hypothetical protein
MSKLQRRSRRRMKRPDRGILAETEGFEYAHFSVGISDFQRSTHVRTHEVVYEF